MKLRRDIYPWDGDTLVDVLISTHPNFPYKDQFAELFLEAYHAYEAGCPHASIITAGEAFLRVVFDRLIYFISEGMEIPIWKGKKTYTIHEESPMDIIYNFTDKLAFCTALEGLESINIFPDELIKKMFIIKDLRNHAAHGELPILHQWDPDDLDSDKGVPSEEELRKLLSRKETDIPEGYRFISKKGGTEWTNIDIRNYQIKSMKQINYNDRFAVIQMMFVIDVISEMIGIKNSKSSSS